MYLTWLLIIFISAPKITSICGIYYIFHIVESALWAILINCLNQLLVDYTLNFLMALGSTLRLIDSLIYHWLDVSCLFLCFKCVLFVLSINYLASYNNTFGMISLFNGFLNIFILLFINFKQVTPASLIGRNLSQIPSWFHLIFYSCLQFLRCLITYRIVSIVPSLIKLLLRLVLVDNWIVVLVSVLSFGKPFS